MVFYPAVIRSHARLTYTEVADFLSAKNEKLKNKSHYLLKHIKNLYELYKVLRQRRCKRGALDFEFPETKVEFGKDRKIKNIVQKVRNDAHRIIEECMLCANSCAAHFLFKNKMPALYRVHDSPKPEKLADLKTFLGELGLKLGGGDLPTPKGLC